MNIVEQSRSWRPLWLVLFWMVAWAPALSDAQQEAEPSAAPATKPEFLAVPNPGTDFWRAVRGRLPDEPTSYRDLPPLPLFGAPPQVSGTTQVQGIDSGVLVNDAGSRWTQFRMTELVPIGKYILGGVLGVIALFYLVRGSVKTPGGKAGKVLFRFTWFDRFAHWLLAVLFIVLAITGLTVSFGRSWLIPVIGAEAFSMAASPSKILHNWSGLVFPLAVLMLFVAMVRDNFYQRGDFVWLLKGGGFFGGHASANKYNAGEKILFWLVFLFGLAVSASGLLLLFPGYGQSRLLLQQAHVVHSLVAIIYIALIFGHIYMATLGVPGTLQGMTRGYVDANWAKSHHDKWYEKQLAGQGLVDEDQAAAAKRQRPVADQQPSAGTS